MAASPMGVILHIEQGTELGTESWFANPESHVSAHFGVAKNGSVTQFVDTDDAAWHASSANRFWLGVEHEGYSGEALTAQQIASTARLLAWCKGREGGPVFSFPLAVTDKTSEAGIAWHGLGGGSWGGHPDCPGKPIVNQRAEIARSAADLLSPPRPDMGADYKTNKPPVTVIAAEVGYWIVCSDGAVFAMGGAPFLGSLGNVTLAAPIVDATATPSRKGLYLIGADGGVFAFGDAKYAGRVHL